MQPRTGTTLFSGGLFWDPFFLNLGFFSEPVLGTNWCTTICTTRPIYAKSSDFYAKSIEFECNKFVLILVQIDLIHFEHSNCISSTWTKTNTDPLHSRLIHSISCNIGQVIQIVVHQFVRKTISTFKLY